MWIGTSITVCVLSVIVLAHKWYHRHAWNPARHQDANDRLQLIPTDTYWQSRDCLLIVDASSRLFVVQVIGFVTGLIFLIRSLEVEFDWLFCELVIIAGALLLSEIRIYDHLLYMDAKLGMRVYTRCWFSDWYRDIRYPIRPLEDIGYAFLQSNPSQCDRVTILDYTLPTGYDNQQAFKLAALINQFLRAQHQFEQA